ncbi:transcription factor bHLH94-like [Impatiens glandulifera]|uniref:transcription factor bHLH94-like n=1 Tax=Impatiens glandulifera TaxID=253017 RepID=UPI001FB067A1|nr:transcription factor bHLH94-like [Impatiens glandulifera]
MGLESSVIFKQDSLFCNESHNGYGYGYGYGYESESKMEPNYWCQSSNSVANISAPTSVVEPGAVGRRMKRRRTKIFKDKQDVENQRMTHIVVERNRRKQMNEYLTVLRSSMPPSYAQKGDQASIVGGAINFVKELEHLVHLLEANKQMKQKQTQNYQSHSNDGILVPRFFAFPQYKIPNAVADIEVTVVDSHANVKVMMSKKQPKHLSKMVAGFHSMALSILHLNVTTILHHSVLYSFCVKVEDNCGLSSTNEIASYVHQMVARIQEEAS